MQLESTYAIQITDEQKKNFTEQVLLAYYLLCDS